jgi:hypothetical protein
VRVEQRGEEGAARLSRRRGGRGVGSEALAAEGRQRSGRRGGREEWVARCGCGREDMVGVLLQLGGREGVL